MAKTMILKGKLFNTQLIIHGEDHSNIDNKYYEALDLSGLLFVEHSNTACEIKPEEEHLFKAHAKGSEWVFYTQKKAGNPKVVCFDTRAEQGYLNAFEEKRMLAIADKLTDSPPEDVRAFVDMVMKSIKALSQNKDVFVKEYFTESFDIIEGQLHAAMKLLIIKKKQGIQATVLGMPLAQLLPGIAYTLASNIRRMTSVSVDMGLIRALMQFAESGEKKIQIFCGKNHLIRISKMLPLTDMKISGLTRQLEEYASVHMEGDPALDQQIRALVA